MTEQIEKDDAYWRRTLSPEEYRICRQKGTEPAFTGAFWDCKDKGMYHCRCCGEPLFDTDTKYDSGSGWPSFYAPLAEEGIRQARDTTLGMERIEVMCDKCGCHLGHLFPDGPAPTGLRYCINSASLTLQPDGEKP